MALDLPNWSFDFKNGTKGEYTLATKEEYEKFRAFADSKDGWNIVYDKPDVKVWDRSSDKSSINIVRLWARLKGIKASILYDVLHDPDYRKTWDDNMVEGFCLQQLDPFNDVGYYCAKSPFFAIQGRDFCNQRCWWVAADKSEYLIFNHSVPHEKCPDKKGYTRAISFMTGYVVRVDKDDPESCTLVYVTQADPKGWIPGWAMNQATKQFAPKLIEKIATVAPGYNDWKKNNNPDAKPWLAAGASFHWEKKEKKATDDVKEKEEKKEEKKEKKEKKGKDKDKEKKSEDASDDVKEKK